MNFIYELLRAGSTRSDSDSGAEVARKVNDNFQKVKAAFQEIERLISNGTKVDIPIGNLTTPGLVKSSESKNEINIHDDGTMEVVSLNTKKLTQDDDDYIILDGNI